MGALARTTWGQTYRKPACRAADRTHTPISGLDAALRASRETSREHRLRRTAVPRSRAARWPAHGDASAAVESPLALRRDRRPGARVHREVSNMERFLQGPVACREPHLPPAELGMTDVQPRARSGVRASSIDPYSVHATACGSASAPTIGLSTVIVPAYTGTSSTSCCNPAFFSFRSRRADHRRAVKALHHGTAIGLLVAIIANSRVMPISRICPRLRGRAVRRHDAIRVSGTRRPTRFLVRWSANRRRIRDRRAPPEQSHADVPRAVARLWQRCSAPGPSSSPSASSPPDYVRRQLVALLPDVRARDASVTRRIPVSAAQGRGRRGLVSDSREPFPDILGLPTRRGPKRSGWRRYTCGRRRAARGPYVDHIAADLRGARRTPAAALGQLQARSAISRRASASLELALRMLQGTTHHVSRPLHHTAIAGRTRRASALRGSTAEPARVL